MVQRCWVNFQCRGVLLIWNIVGQGPIALAVGADGGCLDIFSLIYHFSFLSPSLWETTRYRLKYCLKGPLNPEQPTNHYFLAIFITVQIQHYCLYSDLPTLLPLMMPRPPVPSALLFFKGIALCAFLLALLLDLSLKLVGCFGV